MQETLKYVYHGTFQALKMLTELKAAANSVSKAAGAVTGANNSDDEKSSLKISISLDLDVEVHLTARIKGDIVIGLL